MTKIIGIVAIDENRGMGYRGKLPWGDTPLDAAHFRDLTLGRPVIVGRRTMASMPQLHRRHTIVLSSSELPEKWRWQHITHAEDGLSAITKAVPVCAQFGTDTICVIGGRTAFDSLHHMISEFYITRVPGTYRTDVQFPLLSKNMWHLADERRDKRMTFQRWLKNKPSANPARAT